MDVILCETAQIAYHGFPSGEGYRMSIPPSTIKVTKVEPCGDGKVCITMELVVDVNRMAEVSGQMMRTAVAQMKTAKKKK